MLRRLSIGLLASAVGIAPLPLKAHDGSAEDLGDVMSISLKDVVKPTLGFQGALQGAGSFFLEPGEMSGFGRSFKTEQLGHWVFAWLN